MAKCKPCNGTGALNCPVCKGKGQVSSGGLFPSYKECKHCSGSGKKTCGPCDGTGKS